MTPQVTVICPILFNEKGQCKIAVKHWDDVDRKQVEKIPEGINGVRVFVIKNVDKKTQ